MKIDWSKLERKEDRVRIRWEWAKYDNDLDMLKRFGRTLKGGKRSRLGGATGRGCKPDYFGKKQLVIVKLHYSNNEKSHKYSSLGCYDCPPCCPELCGDQHRHGIQVQLRRKI